MNGEKIEDLCRTVNACIDRNRQAFVVVLYTMDDDISVGSSLTQMELVHLLLEVGLICVEKRNAKVVVLDDN